MTTSTQHSYRPASPAQVDLLSKLCQERGVTYATPRNSTEASREIRRLLAMKRPSAVERIEDDVGVRAGFEDWGGATAFRDDEVSGYGSGARWA